MRERLIYTLYWLLQAVALPFALLYFLHRARADRNYRERFSERLGFLPRHFQRTASGAIWLHAVSVGEVISSVELIRRLGAVCPWAPVYVSCATVAGRKLAGDELAGIAAGVFYAPLDYRFAVRRVLRALRPAAVVVMETEIWPNLYREARRAGAGLLIVNGRISDRTIGRYRRLRWFFRCVLGQADAILAQSERDCERYLAIGAPPERLAHGGNLKFDLRPASKEPPAEIAAFVERAACDRIWIAASTMPAAVEGDVDEDDVIIEAFAALRRRHPNLLLILAPRKPERFDAAAEKLRRAGLPFARRSALDDETAAAPVLLLDSIGELSSLFGRADVVFMGGSLASRGGHNILEPAYFGRPIVVGPHMENFRAIAEDFLAAGAMVEIHSAAELAPAVERLLEDDALRAELGARARAAAERKRGATDRAVREIARLADEKIFRLPPRLLLWPLTLVWRAGGAIRARQQRLQTPVVSVGGIGMGGAGKTPFVLWLAQRSARPAILTRGYRRRASEPVTLLAAGEKASVDITGDEAQIYLRSGVAPVGIGANRFRTGRLMEQRFQPEVFLLDDGFQHRRLARALDIVLIDGLDPFAGGALPPAGRLREPLNALARADVLVITRAARGRAFTGLRAELKRWNPRAPIFVCRTIPEAWIDAASGQEHAPDQPPFSRAAAFCGLANPASFWETLDAIACPTVLRRQFADHHRYSPAEIEHLETADADALVTTEKDLANLPGRPRLPLYWLRIGLEVEGDQDLLRLILG